jgi:hypothetical protein
MSGFRHLMDSDVEQAVAEWNRRRKFGEGIWTGSKAFVIG